MNKASIILSIKKQYEKVDWGLLIFLLLFLNVKLIIKLVALCFIYVRRFNFSFGFRWKQSRLPLFYLAIILIALFNYVSYSLYQQNNYSILLLTGISFWIMCILALHQLTLSVDTGNLQKIHNAIFFFFVVNAAVSFINLFTIIFEIGELNPYRYQGIHQKYYIGTGDYIKGITFDTSTTNALLNAFGLVYFLSRKQMFLSLLCMVVLLLTCSNFTNLLMMACLLFLFVFRTVREQKSVIIICIALLVIFMTNVTPQNNKYATYIVEKTFGRKDPEQQKAIKLIPIEARSDSVLSGEEKKYKYAKLYLDSISLARKFLVSSDEKKNINNPLLYKPEIPKVNIHAPEYQHRQDSSAGRMQAIAFLDQLRKQSGIANKNIDSLAQLNQPPGKVTAYIEVFSFLQKHPSKIITGDGIGNFSSKLAFRATGLKIAGGYPVAYTYISEDFKNNHLSVYLDFFGKDSGFHSIANSPNSFYVQILGEYGLAGVICFLLYYLLYFVKGWKKLTYGLPVLFIMIGAFATEYWFEQLSIVVMFELLILLNRRDTAVLRTKTHE